MAVLNIHERVLPATAEEVGRLIDSLSSGDDLLWPHHDWPTMALDAGLAVDSAGGHGPVRYTVAAYVPGQWVRFSFTGPRGFHGFHEYSIHPAERGDTTLRHTLAMHARGPARLSWPLVFRWLHDACLEDSLDRAEHAVTGTLRRPARWTAGVRLLWSLGRA
ncbi:SRPBCC family protein [Streptomyces sp. NPDC048496]|uniref:SRPBCC family protein n=1 Tax=Streptomyces sp. NPDC048496 TaxID=3365558 RepID=UPI003720C67B